MTASIRFQILEEILPENHVLLVFALKTKRRLRNFEQSLFDQYFRKIHKE